MSRWLLYCIVFAFNSMSLYPECMRVLLYVKVRQHGIDINENWIGFFELCDCRQVH